MEFSKYTGPMDRDYGKNSKEAIVRNLKSAYSKFSDKKNLVNAKEEGRKEAMVNIAKAKIANIPSGGKTGDKGEPSLTASQKEVAQRVGMTSKESSELSDGDVFELPIHESAKNF